MKDPHVRKTIDNWLDDDPFVMARQMQGTAQGVDWLLDHWIELRDTLEIEGYWHYNEKYMALRMLGKRPQDVMEDRSIRNVFLACHAAHPDKWKLFDEFQQARLGVDGKPIYFFRIEEFKKDVPTRETALAQLKELVDGEMDRLTELKELVLDPNAEADKQEAGERAMFDDSAAGTLRRRYESACEREFHRSINEYMKYRKESNREERRSAPKAVENEPVPAPAKPDIIAETAAPKGPPECVSEPVAAPISSKPWVRNEPIPQAPKSARELLDDSFPPFPRPRFKG